MRMTKAQIVERATELFHQIHQNYWLVWRSITDSQINGWEVDRDELGKVVAMKIALRRLTWLLNRAGECCYDRLLLFRTYPDKITHVQNLLDGMARIGPLSILYKPASLDFLAYSTTMAIAIDFKPMFTYANKIGWISGPVLIFDCPIMANGCNSMHLRGIDEMRLYNSAESEIPTAHKIRDCPYVRHSTRHMLQYPIVAEDLINLPRDWPDPSPYEVRVKEVYELMAAGIKAF